MPDIVYLIGHSIHGLFGILLIMSAYMAIKKFRIVIWKRGWYLIMVGGAFVVFFALEELIGIYPHESILYHIFEDLLTYGLIAIGTLTLARIATRLWGG